MDNEQFNALLKWLQAIERHLNGIRSMMTFFVVLAVLAIVIQGCNAVMSFGR